MPTYDYTCPNCEYHTEIFHPMTDNTQYKCPNCHDVLEKQISGGAGIIFKGEGFYATDSKKNDLKEMAKQTKEANEYHRDMAISKRK